ncbi:hypothetical protein SELMODRAFT_425893 [Selaginella moellendorffii]|uniref:Uncharacterized protein n=1 Tax=Selaginella moellendorffii TaxID=88036 RepID=D8SUN1_SELML|nr:hypothetical protein SELMODRAFT_425893 [Selaginella moellendorffii]
MSDSNVVSIDKEQNCQDLITQEEEELYIDRHLPRAQADEIVCEISQVLPQSYRWLGLEEMDSKGEVFRVLNWDVEVRSSNLSQPNKILDQAVEVFQLMNLEGVKPDELMFQSVLTSCSHAELGTLGLDQPILWDGGEERALYISA